MNKTDKEYVDAQIESLQERIEKHIKKSYMRTVQAPMGVKPRLVTWMQLC